MSRFFQLILCTQFIPNGFKRSYIVPTPKPEDTRTEAITFDDFRGISITPILCKVFEYCFLDKFQTLLSTHYNEFGFKKGLGCTHAIYYCRTIIVSNDNYTVNICTLDQTKAFDKVNHHALFSKLMTSVTVDNNISCCYSCVKWNSVWSATFQINFGMRQGSVFHPTYLPFIWMTSVNYS